MRLTRDEGGEIRVFILEKDNLFSVDDLARVPFRSTGNNRGFQMTRVQHNEPQPFRLQQSCCNAYQHGVENLLSNFLEPASAGVPLLN